MYQLAIYRFLALVYIVMHLRKFILNLSSIYELLLSKEQIRRTNQRYSLVSLPVGTTLILTWCEAQIHWIFQQTAGTLSLHKSLLLLLFQQVEVTVEQKFMNKQ